MLFCPMGVTSGEMFVCKEGQGKREATLVPGSGGDVVQDLGCSGRKASPMSSILRKERDRNGYWEIVEKNKIGEFSVLLRFLANYWDMPPSCTHCTGEKNMSRRLTSGLDPSEHWVCPRFPTSSGTTSVMFAEGLRRGSWAELSIFHPWRATSSVTFSSSLSWTLREFVLFVLLLEPWSFPSPFVVCSLCRLLVRLPSSLSVTTHTHLWVRIGGDL